MFVKIGSPLKNMVKVSALGTALLMASVLPVSATQPAAILGPDAAACAPGAKGPAALVRVYGFRDRTGELRVQIYGSNPEEWLEKGKRLKRIQIPMTKGGDMDVCMALPHAGTFALYSNHDRGKVGKRELSKDGYGFSGNPKLRAGPPKHSETVFKAGEGITVVEVAMQYRAGLLSFKPRVPIRQTQ